MTDPITGATVMQEVLTILGPTLSPTGNSNGTVREWCINSGAIDPFTGSALANSEDGTIYRWDFASGSFTQKVVLTAGVLEAYTPTLIGADGTVYAINDAILFAVGQASNLTVASTHAADFGQGQNGAVYTITATNNGTGPTSGIVMVNDILPPGLSAQSISGQGWDCEQPAGPCSRSDSMAAGAQYPPLSLTVNVAGNAPSPLINTAEISADGATNSINSISNDSTKVIPPIPSLSITKKHTGSFTQGQLGATYTVTVSNAAGAVATNGTVLVTESVPEGMSLVSMSGGGWSCPSGSVSCSRSDSLPGGSTSSIVVSVNVANNAGPSAINQVNLSYGGWTSPSALDPTMIVSPCAITNDPSAAAVDVQRAINEALGVAGAVDDLNHDGAVNLVDVQIIVNAVLGKGCF